MIELKIKHLNNEISESAQTSATSPAKRRTTKKKEGSKQLPTPIYIKPERKTNVLFNDRIIPYEYTDTRYETIGIYDADELKDNMKKLKVLIKKIIDTEAPITESFLYKRIINAFKFNRVTPKVTEAVTQALKSLRCYCETNERNGRIYWSKKGDAKNYESYRINKDRDFSEVPMIEVCNAILYVASQHISLDPSDLNKIVINALGFRPIGATRRATISEATNELVQKGKLNIIDNKIALNREE